MHIPFLKMHGTGNDFVIVDAREREFIIPRERIIGLAQRHTGIGFDQLIILKTSTNADVFMQIINADGSEVSACGNATRCVGWLIAQEKNMLEVKVEAKAGVMQVILITPTVYGGGKGGEANHAIPPLTSPPLAGGIVAVNMGEPKFGWQEIPLASDVDTLSVPLTEGNLSHPVAVNIGNPHAIFFLDPHERVDLGTMGKKIEHHSLFPERVNVSVARVLDNTHIKLDVWERGAGITLSCGTAACATLVAAVKRGLISGRKAHMHLPGGDLLIEWKSDNHVWKTGEVAESFRGEFDA